MCHPEPPFLLLQRGECGQQTASTISPGPRVVTLLEVTPTPGTAQLHRLMEGCPDIKACPSQTNWDVSEGPSQLGTPYRVGGGFTGFASQLYISPCPLLLHSFLFHRR